MGKGCALALKLVSKSVVKVMAYLFEIQLGIIMFFSLTQSCIEIIIRLLVGKRCTMTLYQDQDASRPLCKILARFFGGFFAPWPYLPYTTHRSGAPGDGHHLDDVWCRIFDQ